MHFVLAAQRSTVYATMAGLEDFFAKKDKRKGKKKKYTSSSTIAQGIEVRSTPWLRSFLLI